MDEQAFPYRYWITLTVIVEGDGLHADGDGATATQSRLRDLVAADARVLEVHSAGFPANIPAADIPSRVKNAD